MKMSARLFSMLSLVPALIAAPALAQEPDPVTTELVQATEAVAAENSSVRVEVEPKGPTLEAGPELLVEANAAYEAGEYGRAVGLYESLITAGHDSGHLHYNLGNAYLRNGELGRAIASYRRGWLRLPRDEDVRANLTFARKTTQDALAPPAPSAVASTLFFWHYDLSRTELVWLALALNLVFWGLWALRLVRPGSETVRWLTFAVLVPLAAVLISLGVRVLDPQRVAVVVPQEINAQSGPEDGAVVRFKLHAGTEVLLRDRRDGWLRISLPDDQQGWIESKYAEIVEG